MAHDSQAVLKAAQSLRNGGYAIIPTLPYDNESFPPEQRGKAPARYLITYDRWKLMFNWRLYAYKKPYPHDLKEWAQGFASGGNLGLCMGSPIGDTGNVVVAIDDDRDNPTTDLTEELHALLGAPYKVGNRGGTWLVAMPASDMPKVGDFKGEDGKIQIIVRGQTVVPPSMHPKTKKPYEWVKPIVPAAELPVIAWDDLLLTMRLNGYEHGKSVGGQRTNVTDEDLKHALDGEVRENLVVGLTNDEGPLGDLWRLGDASGTMMAEPDKSGSQRRWWLACHMATAGYNGAEFAFACGEWDHARGKNDVTRRQLQRCWAHVIAGNDAIGTGGFETGMTAVEDEDDVPPVMLSPSDDPVVAPIPKLVKELRVSKDGRRIVPFNASHPDAHLMVTAAAIADITYGRGNQVPIPVFRQGNRLVEPTGSSIPVTRGGKTVRVPVAGLVGVTPLRLRALADPKVCFMKAAKGQEWNPMTMTSAQLPLQVFQALTEPGEVSQADWLDVVGVAEGPIVRADGSLFRSRGYDVHTQLWCAGSPVEEVKTNPTLDDAQAALTELEGLLDEFFFDSEASRAAALSGLLTAVMRPVLRTAPLVVIDANTPGTGKSYLAELMYAMTSAETPAVLDAPSPEEFQKRIDAAIMAQPTAMLWDDFGLPIGGHTLNAILTNGAVQPRILGKSESAKVACRSLILICGNNVSFAAEDMIRRVLYVRMVAPVERPELIKRKHDPVGEVRMDRGRFVALVATIVRAYLQAGAPTSPTLAGFDEWARLCVGPLIWLGRENPLKNQEAVREEMSADDPLDDLIAAWKAVFGFNSISLKDVLQVAEGYTVAGFEDLDYDRRGALKDAVRAIYGPARGAMDAHLFGRKIAKYKNKVKNGFTLSKVEADTRLKRWILSEISNE